jgi:hypothetical protein
LLIVIEEDALEDLTEANSYLAYMQPHKFIKPHTNYILKAYNKLSYARTKKNTTGAQY